MKAFRIPALVPALVAVALASTAVAQTPAAAPAAPAAQAPAAAQKPVTPPTVTVDGKTIPMPEPTVPQMMTLEGEFVRVAYNNEAIVNLGYRIAQGSVGEDWMYLQAAIALRQGVKYQTIKRDAFSVKLPDGTIVPLATQKDYSAALGLQALNARAKVQKDSLSYFPPGVRRTRPFRFFADLGKGNPTSFDEVDLDDLTAVMGRLFFKIPGKIQTGQHYFIVKFKDSELQVPFRILTKEEDKEFKKTWQDFQKALEAEFQK